MYSSLVHRPVSAARFKRAGSPSERRFRTVLAYAAYTAGGGLSASEEEPTPSDLACANETRR